MNQENFRYKTDKKFVAVLGDVHCNWSVISEFCKNYQDTLIIQAGDFGLGFHHPKKEYYALKKLNKTLHDSHNELIAIRGNHDNPKRFVGKWVEEEILLADDYHIVEFGDIKIQLVGGAISIDREERIAGQSWWSGEQIKFQPERIEKVDVLITHAPPKNSGLSKADCNDTVRHFHAIEASQGGDLLGELQHEQNLVQKISDLTECKSHYFGHLHVSSYYIDPANGRKYICLKIDEFREIK